MESITYYLAKFVQNYLRLSAIKGSIIDKTARVCSGTTLNNAKVGRYSYIGHGSRINNCEIGSFSSIAGDVFIGGSSHPVEWASTSPVFHSKKNVLKKSFSDNTYITSSKTTVGNDVWIASNVLIKAGVNIGNGAVIGMGSVVTKDVPDYEIWAGNPAKCIRKRFDDSIIKRIQVSRWWNLSDEQLSRCGDLFCDVEKLLSWLENQDLGNM